MKQKLFMVLSILTFCIFLTSCGKKSVESQIDDTTWYYCFYSSSSENYYYDSTIKINADGTASFTIDDEEKATTWKLNDKESVISFEFSGAQIDYRLNFEKNDLVSIAPLTEEMKFEDFYYLDKEKAAKKAKEVSDEVFSEDE